MEHLVLPVWDGEAPGGIAWSGPESFQEVDVPDIGRVQVVSNVSEPSLTVFPPSPGRAGDSAVIILPGGGYEVLVWDMEGTEIAQWFAARGVTAFVLKYRMGQPAAAPEGAVPADIDARLRAMSPRRELAVMDARQALKRVRQMAGEFDYDPEKVGMIGFSAGAITLTSVIVDAMPDRQPDFAVPVYGTLPPDSQVPDDAPPVFIATAQDDAVALPRLSLEMYEKWTGAGRPGELHIFEKGGHGFAMRSRGAPVDAWPQALEAWLVDRGFITGPE